MPNTEIEICFYEVRELNPNKFFFPNVIMNILLIFIFFSIQNNNWSR